MEKDKSCTPQQLVLLAESWEEDKKKKRSVALIAGEVEKGKISSSFYIGGNERDLVIILAQFIKDNREIVKMATMLAETLIETEKKKKKGLLR